MWQVFIRASTDTGVLHITGELTAFRDASFLIIYHSFVIHSSVSWLSSNYGMHSKWCTLSDRFSHDVAFYLSRWTYFFPRIYVIATINIRAYFPYTVYIKPAGALEKQQEFLRGITQTPTAMLGFWPLPPSVGYDKVLWALVKIILTRMRVCQVMQEPCINYFVLLYTQELSAICNTDNSSKLKGVGELNSFYITQGFRSPQIWRGALDLRGNKSLVSPWINKSVNNQCWWSLNMKHAEINLMWSKWFMVRLSSFWLMV